MKTKLVLLVLLALSLALDHRLHHGVNADEVGKVRWVTNGVMWTVSPDGEMVIFDPEGIHQTLGSMVHLEKEQRDKSQALIKLINQTVKSVEAKTATTESLRALIGPLEKRFASLEPKRQAEYLGIALKFTIKATKAEIAKLEAKKPSDK